MRIIDLKEAHLPSYFTCLEPWSEEMKEAGPHKARWYAREKNRGLRVKLAVDVDRELAGMIQYLPAREVDVVGEKIYAILCIWVHGHKQGIGNRQGHGLGTALLQAAEMDAEARGAAGMAAWGLSLPIWMKASWFKKHGYRQVDRDGLRALLFKPFVAGAKAPAWMRPRKTPQPTRLPIVVTQCVNGWCQGMNIAHERMQRAAALFPNDVRVEHVDTADPRTREEWGLLDASFVGDKKVRFGPPPSETRLAKMLTREVRKHRRHVPRQPK